MEFSNKFRIINTVDFGRRLLEYLPYRETLGHIGADSVGSAPVLGQKITDHLCVLEGVNRGIPSTVRNKDTFRSSNATNSIGELFSLVRSRCSYKGLRVVVLLLECFDKGSNIRKQGAGNDNL